MTAGIHKRRNRRLIVCVECRRRKLRCDRNHPCRNCLKAASNCEYRSREGTSLEDVNVREILGGEGASRGDIGDDSPSILDTKLTGISKSVIVSKPSRTIFLGALSSFLPILSRPYFKSLLSEFEETMGKEKLKWKNSHKPSHHAGIIVDGEADEVGTAEMVQRIICPNYYAFQERLIYFQNNLNGLLFGGFVPMGAVHSLFFSYFPTIDGQTQFNVPQKAHYYADISLITSLVYLVLIFTRYSSDGAKFRYQLVATADDLITLATTSLATSQFRRKKSQQAVLALILMRVNLFVYENSEGELEEIESYPIFQMCLDLCYQVGLHADPDVTDTVIYKDRPAMKIRLMTSLEVKQLWNYIQAEDAYYSAIIGTPLLINYHFCAKYWQKSNSFFDLQSEKAVFLMRDLSSTINSCSPVSLRDILTLIDRILRFCHDLPAKLLRSETADLDELAHLCKLKLLLLQLVARLCRIVTVGISELRAQSLDEGEANMLGGLSKEMYRQSLIANACLLYHIKYICEGKSVFGPDGNGKYIVFFRDAFARSLAPCFVLWFTFLLPRVTRSPELVREMQQETMLPFYPPEENGYRSDIDLPVLERALFHDYENEKPELAEQICTKLLTSAELMKFVSSFYDVVGENEILKTSLDSFLTLRYVITWLYLVRMVEEFKDKLESRQMSLADIVGRVKVKIEQHFADNEDLQFEKILDSIFAGEDWLNMGDI
ncbi:DEKNAAC103208 [Brettanomyces naardenensis]|uniref:DEKNAAC103208 n=1 Tax=Brettanomyces naardenensis TaxID=13370 RepID=A0A448YMP5_BRENA|nr:DEKNAAC103208 [Brettanomyces naardenensis]